MLSRLTIVVLSTLLLASVAPVHADEGKSRLVHVVLVWLKEPGNPDHRARIVEATRSFMAIPGVEEIAVGEPVSSERPMVDDSFDVGLYMVFTSREALEAYQAHPMHEEALGTILRPLASRTVVYDFEDRGD